MEIRKATAEDIPEIVTLLKVSLGESLMPKSVAYWGWKHVENPFGASPILLAIEADKIIGVRAFMRWKWRAGERVMEAVRAVDTATHPDFQGKGVFTELTLSLLEHCKNAGLHMVFNTPNEKSKPGYLKMGWTEAGKLPVGVKLINPLRMGLSLLMGTREAEVYDQRQENRLKYFLHHPGLSRLIENNDQNRNNLYNTAHTVESLRWRYEQAPIITYFADGVENTLLNLLLIYRIKTSRLGKEMRITDLFSDSSITMSDINSLLKRNVKFHKADYVTWSELSSPREKYGLTFLSRRLGPTVTVRNISSDSIDRFYNFHEWRPSLGDLELF